MPEGQTHCSNCNDPLSPEDFHSEPQGPRGNLLCDRCRRASRSAARGGWHVTLWWDVKDGLTGTGLAVGKPIPWADSKVALILVTKDGHNTATHTRMGKRQVLSSAAADDVVLAAWPGERRQEIFLVTTGARRTASAALR
jgi:hypothetical protein